MAPDRLPANSKTPFNVLALTWHQIVLTFLKHPSCYNMAKVTYCGLLNDKIFNGTISLPLQTSKRYFALDGLRGLAALVVVERHCSHWFDNWNLPSGYLAVDFFFLLSGFVIANAYDRKLEIGLGWTAFMSRRLLRILPLYIVGLTLSAWVLAAKGELRLEDAVLALVFLPRITLSNATWLVAPAWSLAAELLANCAFAAFWRSLKGRRLLVATGVFAVLIASCAMYFGSLDVGYQQAHFVGGLARVMFSFFLGVVIARYCYALPKFACGAWPSMVALIGLLAITVPHEFRGAMDTVIVIFCMPIILVLAAGSAPNDFSKSVLGALGDMSYALYVVHSGVIGLVDHIWKNVYGQHATQPIVLSTCIIFATATASLVLQRCYDVPTRSFIQNIFSATLKKRLGRPEK